MTGKHKTKKYIYILNTHVFGNTKINQKYETMKVNGGEKAKEKKS